MDEGEKAQVRDECNRILNELVKFRGELEDYKTEMTPIARRRVQIGLRELRKKVIDLGDCLGVKLQDNRDI